MLRTISFAPGDTIEVFEKIREMPSSEGKESKAPKTRIQSFKGIVIKIRGRNKSKSFTLRKVVGEIGVEKIWPIASPDIEKIVVKEHPKKRIRRSKLYYLRNKAN